MHHKLSVAKFNHHESEYNMKFRQLVRFMRSCYLTIILWRVSDGCILVKGALT